MGTEIKINYVVAIPYNMAQCFHCKAETERGLLCVLCLNVVCEPCSSKPFHGINNYLHEGRGIYRFMSNLKKKYPDGKFLLGLPDGSTIDLSAFEG